MRFPRGIRGEFRAIAAIFRKMASANSPDPRQSEISGRKLETEARQDALTNISLLRVQLPGNLLASYGAASSESLMHRKRLVSWNRPLCDRTRAGVRSSKAAGHDCSVKTARKCDPHSALGAKSNSNSYWSDQAGPTKGGAGLASSHLQAGVI
jgi:hypothetical protein